MQAWPLRVPHEQRTGSFPCYTVLGQVFNPTECRQIIEYAQANYQRHHGTLADADQQNTQADRVRKGHVSWIDPADPNSRWIFERCTAAVLQVNHVDWQFDLDYIGPLQFTCYDQLGDHYAWHVDTNQDPKIDMSYRKLSFTIQLSQAATYQGGELELLFGPDPIRPPRDVGTFVAFPSMITHRVTPVTQGKRYSLVGWVTGPRFR